jgi:ribulose-phosphate 3-epimerase
MLNKLLVSPSIIASDLTLMGSLVKEFDKEIVDLLHIDVMDGNFVPNITFGPDHIASLKKHTSIPLDIHLMIKNPEHSLDRYCDLDPWAVTIHYESTSFPVRLLQRIRERGSRAGLTINPATPVSAIVDLLPYCDMVLIMSVEPGFYGQSFLPEALGRIAQLKSYIDSMKAPTVIQVDGGITSKNIRSVVEAGASVIVAGSSAFSGGLIHENITALKKAARG